MKTFLKRQFVNIGLPFLLLIHLLALLNTKFTAWPEMINWPYLILNGFLPYRDIAIAHNPLLLCFLSFFYKAVGVGVWNLMVFTWMTIIFTDILLFYVIEKLLNPKIAVIGLAFFIPWQVFYDGNGLWFDIFLTPFILSSYYFTRNKKYLLGGVFWTLAFLTKQTAVWFLIPIIYTIYTLQGSPLKDRAKEFIFGIGAILLPFFLLLISYNLISDYLFWTVKFGIFTLPRSQGQIIFPSVKQFIIYFFPFIPLLYLLIQRKLKVILLVLWTIAGIFSVYPRFEAFHFQPALPFLAIGFSYILARHITRVNTTLKSFCVLYLVLSVVFVGRFFVNNYNEKIRFYDTKTVETAEYLKKITDKNKKTYFLNIWENMYFMTNTLPATKPLVPHLSWYMELPNLQDKIVDSLKNENPKNIFVGEFTGGGLSSYIPKKVYSYITSEYNVANVVNGITIYEKQ